MSSTKRAITRDFVYMDVERVRSIYAQLHEGLLEGHLRERGSEQKLEGEAEGGLPFLGSVTATGSSLWNRKDSETWTLHDHLFNVVEERVSQLDCFLDLQERFGPTGERWNRAEASDAIKPTDFIRVRGHVRLKDYAGMSRFLRSLHDIVSNAVLMDALEDPKATKRSHLNQIVQQKTAEIQLPDKRQLEALASIMEDCYGDSVTSQLFPFAQHDDCVLLSRLSPESLREPLATLLYKFGATPHDEWTLFGQLAQITGPADSASERADLTVDSVEKTIGTVFERFRPLLNQFSVKYPAISITPIALYRE